MIIIKTILLNHKGFSLVELVVSILILSLVAIAFMSLFSSSLTTIFSQGSKDAAITIASDIMESLYQKQGNDGLENDVEQIIEDLIEEYQTTDTSRYSISFKEPIEILINENGTSIKGYKITITVSYQGGEVSLTSFFRGRDPDANNGD